MLTLPGLIDVHVHLRDPGQTEKEDFFTGTSAALAGGFTTILDMPNNKVPITTLERLEEKIRSAQEKTVCDVGFYFGSLGDNFGEFNKAREKVFGIKLYLNVTTGHYLIDEETLKKIYLRWSDVHVHSGGVLPVLVHAEEKMIEGVLNVVKKTRYRTHFCHVSSENELNQIIKAKESGLPITCGVCPHHLFLTEDDVKTLKSFAMMKPTLRTKKDQEFMWRNLNYIDVVESDHAPHTIDEKHSDSPPFGVPGLETTLPLLLTAEKDRRITRKQILDMCYVNPSRIFNISTDSQTKVEVDLTHEFEIRGENLHTKCKWTPFEGLKVKGKVRRVFIRGQKVFEDDIILIQPGFGRIIRPYCSSEVEN